MVWRKKKLSMCWFFHVWPNSGKVNAERPAINGMTAHSSSTLKTPCHSERVKKHVVTHQRICPAKVMLALHPHATIIWYHMMLSFYTHTQNDYQINQEKYVLQTTGLPPNTWVNYRKIPPKTCTLTPRAKNSPGVFVRLF